jgi:hypothetical protein
MGLAAALTGAVSLADRTELRVRSPGADDSQPSADAETVMTARVTLEGHTTSLDVSYTPRLTLWDANTSARAIVLMNAGEVRGRWSSRGVTLALGQSARYGQVNIASVALTPVDGQPGRVDVVPISQSLAYEQAETSLVARVERARWVVGSTVSYQVSGGADSAARVLLPLQYGPGGELRAAYAASRRTQLITAATGSETAFSTGSEIVLVDLTQGVRTQWSAGTETGLTLGASTARVRAAADAEHRFTAYPVAEMQAARASPALGGRLTLRGALRLAPVVNRLVGQVDERLQAVVAGGWTKRKWTVTAYANAQQSVPPGASGAVQLLVGEVGCAYAVSPAVTLDAGARTLVQRAYQPADGAAPTAATFLQFIAFAGLTVRAPTSHFSDFKDAGFQLGT